MKQLTGFAALVLFCIVSWTDAGNAAQENFEINLKELRPAPVGAAKTGQRSSRNPELNKTRKPPETGKTGESSFYIVRPGDHLFSILMRYYRLSNEAAERLIPEVMRLNNVSNPQGLTIGQRLTIPLTTPPERPIKAARKTTHQASPVPVQTTVPALIQAPLPQASEPKTSPKPSIKSHAVPQQAAATTTQREVSINAAQPCVLAHEIVKQLNLLVPSANLISMKDALTAEHSGMKVVIACGLSPDNTYTYERLLARHGIQLLVFTGDESSSSVIRKMANRLSLPYQQSETGDTGDLPLSYLFTASKPNSQDIRITIVNK